MLCNHFLIKFLNKPKLFFFLPTILWFQEFVSNPNNSIRSFVCTKLNGFKYCYVAVTI